ncbi:UDP-2,3-diacylglucosamine diphosphatase [Roseospirillum parvum]|uniref:UDP-2,3-diacylglucosamine pyrophosphatase LpxH n=1 Tax=Roseospirillum parvum TaxID=83401 RepID=A0A1G7UWE6_9PROT|nr:UDP-2,3-diacylglucosamine diphosphatase [Roseospirillum parvum]SDG51816.1 UDP-2,3-diacylglucosamine pyrophosphatase LpxH [Roseospirillum parvum]
MNVDTKPRTDVPAGSSRLDQGRSVTGGPPPGDQPGDEPRDEPQGPRRYRSIFISDIHLGTRGCKAEFLLGFLRDTESENLYLVGDIIDGWRLRRTWYWPQAHNDVVQKLLRKARKGTRVVFIPGNHDEFVRDYLDNDFGSVEIEDEVIHTGADGKRYLVLHGDRFDGVVKHAKWLAHLGDTAYQLALTVNNWLNSVRRSLGLSYWSLSKYLKHKVKNAVQFIDDYENTLAAEARKREVDGIVCGHIHHAEKRIIGDVLYCNSGDWVESCTAIVEHWDGTMEVLDWTRVESIDDPQYAPVGAPKAARTPGQGLTTGTGVARVGIAREDQRCESLSSRMRGFLRSMVSSARSTP